MTEIFWSGYDGRTLTLTLSQRERGSEGRVGV